MGIHSYSWGFGGEPQNDADPRDSTDINPTVTYRQPGEKTVILTVWDNDPVAGASGSGSEHQIVGVVNKDKRDVRLMLRVVLR